MSVMSETAVGLSDVITMGNQMITAGREALNDLEAFFYLLGRWSGQRGGRDYVAAASDAAVTDDSIPPAEMTRGAEAEMDAEAPAAEDVDAPAAEDVDAPADENADSDSEAKAPAAAEATTIVEAKPEPEKAQAASVRTAKLEEVRPLLASKSRKGFRAEVKALLTKYGAEKLSDIKDEAVLGAILTEAERLGDAT